ncbi:MAG: isochorismatase family protein [Rhodospirillales bacterium]|nr:isochorismatase family protein [Rhodospirillales bacterium]
MDIASELPLAYRVFDAAARPAGLVIVDIVNGFASVGAGPLAPPAADDQVTRMIGEADRLACAFLNRNAPVLAFQDSHQPGKPEPPYPPHCEQGSGQDELVPALAWLQGQPLATLVRKDCINGFVGAIDLVSGRNRVVDWVNAQGLETVLVVGICTDICVMDFVLTMLSARNHGMMPALRDVVVYEPGCATYDLPRAAAGALGLPETAIHPKALTHHVGLYLMASRGAILADEVAA